MLSAVFSWLLLKYQCMENQMWLRLPERLTGLSVCLISCVLSNDSNSISFIYVKKNETVLVRIGAVCNLLLSADSSQCSFSGKGTMSERPYEQKMLLLKAKTHQLYSIIFHLYDCTV